MAREDLVERRGKERLDAMRSAQSRANQVSFFESLRNTSRFYGTPSHERIELEEQGAEEEELVAEPEDDDLGHRRSSQYDQETVDLPPRAGFRFPD